MIPYLHIDTIHLGPLPVHPFGVLVAIGVSVGVWLALARARRVGVDVKELGSFIGWILGCGFIGAHVLDSIFYHPRDVLERPWTLLAIWAGLSSFGGFIGGLVGAVAWKHLEMREVFRLGEGLHLVRPCRRRASLPMLPYVDVVLAVFPVAWIFGRAGCAVVHDHPGARAASDSLLGVAYGRGPVDHWWIFELRHGLEARYDLGLLEMVFAAALACVFALTWRRGGASGWYVVATCVLYAPVRFALDFLRIEDAGGDPRYGGLTPAQWACGALLLFGIGLGWHLRALAGARHASASIRAAES